MLTNSFTILNNVNMKKTVLGIMAAAAITLGMTSCAEKLLTPEQVEEEITTRVEEAKPAIEEEENALCDEEFDTRVAEEVANMKEAEEGN